MHGWTGAAFVRWGSGNNITVSVFAAALVVTSVIHVDVPAAGGHADEAHDVEVVLLGDEAALAEAVDDVGGTVSRSLPVLDAVVASVPEREIGALSVQPGVRSVSPNAVVTVAEQATDEPTERPSLPPSVHREVIGIEHLASMGYTGAGSTIALVDTGVSDLPELGEAVLHPADPRTGKSVACINFSGEPGCEDSYGHGTFLAGLIAGSGGPQAAAGVAPGARILSVKIAGRDGSADVGTVLAAIEWVVSFSDTYGIRVLNLALGTDSARSYMVDPLNYAVERAWAAGVAVVVAASNRGPEPETISKPGDDPWVITVGALDDRGTAGLDDDTLPDFSGRGPTAADGIAKPDLVAPGARLVSLRVPGSAIDTNVPPAVDDPVYRSGSGTSMATALVSGAVAVMLQVDPSMSPNRVKHALAATARAAASDDPMAVGAGVIDVSKAALDAPAGLANQGLTPSSGEGALAGSRGSMMVRATNGTIVTGDVTQQLQAHDRSGYKARAWTPSSWLNSAWHGSSWYGSSWYGSSWYGSSWYGSSWYGVHHGSSWYGSSWYGSSWYGAWE